MEGRKEGKERREETKRRVGIEKLERGWIG